tara:strand:- start:502 stop:813 length:312 start_codon:yes stop_codon:yes gene_type:complete
MSKLLQTRLPLAQGIELTPELFNRLVRILEINLSAIDPDKTPSFNATEISELQFATGSIIFNTSNEIHQGFDGTVFRNLYEHQTYPSGLGVTTAIGSVTVTIT